MATVAEPMGTSVRDGWNELRRALDSKGGTSFLCSADEGQDRRLVYNPRLKDGLFGLTGLDMWVKPRADVIDAVLVELADYPFYAKLGCDAVLFWVTFCVEWPRTLEAYRRCWKIVKKEEPRQMTIATELEPAEKSLLETYLYWEKEVASAREKPFENYKEYGPDTLFWALRALAGPINRFFDECLVMHPDKEIRARRIGMVQAIVRLTDGFVDLTKLH